MGLQARMLQLLYPRLCHYVEALYGGYFGDSFL